jgi:hypothetical protein
MTHLVYQAFGEGKERVDLYDDVLQVPKEGSLAQLRKAYYKQVRFARRIRDNVEELCRNKRSLEVTSGSTVAP